MKKVLMTIACLLLMVSCAWADAGTNVNWDTINRAKDESRERRQQQPIYIQPQPVYIEPTQSIASPSEQTWYQRGFQDGFKAGYAEAKKQ